MVAERDLEIDVMKEPTAADHVRSYDFVFDRCANGQRLKCLTVVDEWALLTAAQEFFDHFGEVADPYMTTVGYFNSLRELGGMRTADWSPDSTVSRAH